MTKRLVSAILIVVLSFALTACSQSVKANSGSKGVVTPDNPEQKPEITILANIEELEAIKASTPLKNYIEKFQERYGVQIKLQGIGSKNSLYYIGSQIFTDTSIDQFRKELAVKLYAEDGPELIYYRSIPYDALIKQGVVADVSGKIPNLNKLHPGLTGKEVYYVPISLRYTAIILNKGEVDSLGVQEPNFSWSKEDFFNLKKQWLQKNQKTFTSNDYLDLLQEYIFPLKILSVDQNSASVSNQAVITAINNMKQAIFEGEFKLPAGYNYQNYYNLLFDSQSEEYTKDRELAAAKEAQTDMLRNTKKEYKTNALHPIDTSYSFTNEDMLIRPDVLEDKLYISSEGFLVNKSGKNIELACEFINGLLEDDVQLSIYNDQPFPNYPVSKAIDGELSKIEKEKNYAPEAIELKNYLLKQVEQGNAALEITKGEKEQEIRWMLVKDLTQFIFVDKDYNEGELSAELKKLENKYNIWLSE